MPVQRARKKYRVSINRDWCKGCAICSSFCPTKVLSIDELDKAVVLHAEACTGCRLCELRCPDFAIEVTEAGSPPAPGSGKAVAAEVDLAPGGEAAGLEHGAVRQADE